MKRVADSRGCVEIMEARRQSLPLSAGQQSHLEACQDCQDVLNVDALFQEAIPQMAGYSSGALWEKIGRKPKRFGLNFFSFPMALAAAVILIFFAYGRLLKFAAPQQGNSLAELGGSQAKVTDLIGVVMSRASSRQPWVRVGARTVFQAGAYLKVPFGSAIRILFPGGTQVSLHGEALAQIRSLAESGRERDYFYLTMGKTFIIHAERALLVETPTISVHPIGTIFSIDQGKDVAEVSVYEGEVRVVGKQGTARVRSHQHVLVSLNSPMRVAHFRSEEASPWEKAHLKINNIPLYQEQMFWNARSDRARDMNLLMRHIHKHDVFVKSVQKNLEEIMKNKHEQGMKKADETMRHEEEYQKNREQNQGGSLNGR